MHVVRKLAALLAIAEASEGGCKAVREILVQAAAAAQAEIGDTASEIIPEEILLELCGRSEWIDKEPWLAAFERYLASAELPSPNYPINPN